MDAAHDGDGYCNNDTHGGYHGPRCELCNGLAYSKYFDRLEARCRDCGDVTARSTAIFVAALVLFPAGVGFNTASKHLEGVRAFAILLRGARRAKVIWKAAGMRFKVKALVGFYQCIAAVPSVYNVVPPLGLEEYTRWIDLFELPSDLENMFVPSACLGDYRTRIMLGSLWPIILVLIIAAVLIVWELIRLCSRKTELTPQSVGFAVRTGLQRVLPLTLFLSFLVVPSVSTRVFKAFLCEPIKYSEDEVRRYLRADLTLVCDSSEHDETTAAAYLFIAMWPVGIPLLYLILLALSRKAIRDRVPTTLSSATAFLWGDYLRSAFWWEPFEMCRKLILSAWVLMIKDDAEHARALVALLTSVVFLVLHTVVRPLRRHAATVSSSTQGRE